MNRCAALVLAPLLALVIADASAQAHPQAHPQAHAPATTRPLPSPVATPSDQPLQRQTGMAVIEREGGQRIIVRSLAPDSLVGGDRLDFAVLDANADGRVDRGEARADRHLWAEFGQLDGNGDGGLDRAELADWIH